MIEDRRGSCYSMTKAAGGFTIRDALQKERLATHVIGEAYKMANNVPAVEKSVEIQRIMFEHNVFIIWKPEYNLGIPIIDEQHRGIVTIINSLHFGMENNYVKGILTPTIEMMNSYVRVHFQVEENYIEQIDFPNAKKHRELHDELSSKLANTGRASLLDKNPYQFMDFLKKWWIDHICIEDLKFRDYLISSTKK